MILATATVPTGVNGRMAKGKHAEPKTASERKKRSVKSAPSFLDENPALKNTLMQIEKEFGEGSIMPLGADAQTQIEGISSGSLSVDIALGGKGFPRGRIIEVFGPESSGKTTLALHAIAAAQRAGASEGSGGIAAFIDAEHALDPSWAKNWASLSRGCWSASLPAAKRR